MAIAVVMIEHEAVCRLIRCRHWYRHHTPEGMLRGQGRGVDFHRGVFGRSDSRVQTHRRRRWSFMDLKVSSIR